MSAKPLITFYGDDFTGSSAVMEVLAFAGVPTVMFLDVPTRDMLAKANGARAIGIAGISRSKDPSWMSRELPRFFEALTAIGAPLMHYKTCSTFDSSPHLGSIGRAAEIGLGVTGAAWAPLVVGAPAIGRYQIFGNLFATLDGTAYRLDRHPVMARHPATPMSESDLCRHLDAQTDMRKAVVDFRALLTGQGSAVVAAARANGARLIALDVFDQPTLAEAGCLIWRGATQGAPFVVGSQGVEYALVAHWRDLGLLPATFEVPPVSASEPLLVVSGSCSQITADQISAAEAAGFAMLRLDASKAIHPHQWQAALADVEQAALSLLAARRSVLVFTARGPDDPAILAFNTALASSGCDPSGVHSRIGAGLGRLVRTARRTLGLRRAILSGGDTSGHGMLAVGAQALAPVSRLADGVPLIRVLSGDVTIDGLEVALKGGQMGDVDLFVRARTGNPETGN